MKNKKLVVTPPGTFADSNSYLSYITNLIANKSISIQIIKSIPLIANNSKPVSIVGEGLSAPHGFIQNKLVEMNEDHLQSVSNYFVERSIKSEYLMGYDSPTELRKKELDITDCLMWAIEISSDYNMWNELFGTNETELAKEAKLPSLCIPSDLVYSKPESLLIISKDDADLTSYMPLDIIDRFDLKVTLMIDTEDEDLSRIYRMAQSLNLDHKIQIIKAGFVDGEDILQSYIKSADPSWIAYHNFDKSFINRAFNMNTNNFILSAKRPILIL